MNSLQNLESVNTILYCARWQETVDFYRHVLQLPVIFATDWFIEFSLTDSARLSVADQSRAAIKTAAGKGITLTLQVANIEEAWQELRRQGVMTGPIKHHTWGAQVFYFTDPEGHRLEIWTADICEAK